MRFIQFGELNNDFNQFYNCNDYCVLFQLRDK